MHCSNRTRRNSGFSMIELVIVVVIIGIIAAIAVPRMSRGAAGAAESALTGDLATLRNAIDLYQTEHGGTFPDATNVNSQLKGYTDDQGNVSPTGTKTGNFIYGPYIRDIPALPVGAAKGGNVIAAATGTSVGWIYTASTGAIVSNTTTAEIDSKSKAYSSY